jgi:pimeloyl-ACP methyl ester carboxylesterase
MLSEEKPMDFEQTLPREQHTMRFKGGLVRRIAGIALWTAVAYVLLHLALVPVFSLLTRTEHKKGNTPRNWGLAYQSHEVKGFPGFTIPAWYVPGAANKPIILVLTGSGGNKYGTIAKLMTLFLHEKGYNVFLFDTRGQGQSWGIKTYGIGEAADVVRVLDHLSKIHPDKKIGAVGFSLGAASILRAAGMDARLRAVAAYASYSELDSDLIRSEVAVQLKTMLRGKVPRKRHTYADYGVKAARWIVCPALVRVSLKLWSVTFRSIPTPQEAVAAFGDRALLLMQNDGDPEIPARQLDALYQSAQTAKKQKMSFRSNTHEPPFWNEQFRGRFKAIIQGFFGKNLK